MVHLPHLYLTTGKAIVAVVQSLSHVRLFASSWTAALHEIKMLAP